jgi:hypothetical protein
VGDEETSERPFEKMESLVELSELLFVNRTMVRLGTAELGPGLSNDSRSETGIDAGADVGGRIGVVVKGGKAGMPSGGSTVAPALKLVPNVVANLSAMGSLNWGVGAVAGGTGDLLSASLSLSSMAGATLGFELPRRKKLDFFGLPPTDI